MPSEDAVGGARTEKEIADMVMAAHKKRQREREEAERQNGLLPERSYSPDPPSTPDEPSIEYSIPSDEFVVKVPVSLPAKYAFLNANLKEIVDNFTSSATMAEGDREWQAQIASEFLMRARELCLKMIG